MFKTKTGTELPLLDMRGKPYLQVAHRILWFREEHPNYSIQTEIVSSNAVGAVFKATIRDDKGVILSTAHKVETKEGFEDFVEKAETGAIGRALALVGYGTQFCAQDLDEGNRLADAPVAMAQGAIPVTATDQVHACGNKMMVSKYREGEWYCFKCKMSVPMAAVKQSTQKNAGEIAAAIAGPPKGFMDAPPMTEEDVPF